MIRPKDETHQVHQVALTGVQSRHLRVHHPSKRANPKLHPSSCALSDQPTDRSCIRAQRESGFGRRPVLQFAKEGLKLGDERCWFRVKQRSESQVREVLWKERHRQFCASKEECCQETHLFDESFANVRSQALDRPHEVNLDEGHAPTKALLIAQDVELRVLVVSLQKARYAGQRELSSV